MFLWNLTLSPMSLLFKDLHSVTVKSFLQSVLSQDLVRNWSHPCAEKSTISNLNVSLDWHVPAGHTRWFNLLHVPQTLYCKSEDARAGNTSRCVTDRLLNPSLFSFICDSIVPLISNDQTDTLTTQISQLKIPLFAQNQRFSVYLRKSHKVTLKKVKTSDVFDMLDLVSVLFIHIQIQLTYNIYINLFLLTLIRL